MSLLCVSNTAHQICLTTFGLRKCVVEGWHKSLLCMSGASWMHSLFMRCYFYFRKISKPQPNCTSKRLERSRAHDQSRVQKPQTANNKTGLFTPRVVVFLNMCCTESVIDSSGRALAGNDDDGWWSWWCDQTAQQQTAIHPSTHFTPSAFLGMAHLTSSSVSISLRVLQTPWKEDFFENCLFNFKISTDVFISWVYSSRPKRLL